MNRFFFLVGVLSIFLMPVWFVFAMSSGFADSQITLSNKRPQEGESVELSVVFNNYESEILRGDISFYDGSELLGSRVFEIEAGNSETISLSWTASLGDHSFVAKAEKLRLGNSNVKILTPATEPLAVSVGFKNSQISASLGESGSFMGIVSGLWIEAKNFVVPIVNSIDMWRFERVSPWETTKLRVQSDKDSAQEGKIRAILTMHILGLSILLGIFKSKIIFFVLFGIVSVWILIKIIKKIKGIFRKKYTEDE